MAAENLVVALQGVLNPDVAKSKIFTGEENTDVRKFLEEYEEYMVSRNKGDDANKKTGLKNFLGGMAKTFYQNEEEAFQGLENFAGYKKKLVEEFDRGNGDMESFLNRIQGTNENPFKFVGDKRKLAFRAKFDPNSKDVIKAVIRGLKQEIVDKIYMANNNTYVDLKENIQRAILRINEEKLTILSEASTINLVSNSARETHNSVESRLSNLEKNFKAWENNFNAWGSRMESLICNYNMSHQGQNSQAPQNNFQNFGQDPRLFNPYVRRCYECNEPIHLRNRCPRLFGQQMSQQPLKNANIPDQGKF